MPVKEYSKSILIVCGNKNVMRRVFEREGVAYWSAAIHSILEKHGILDIDIKEFDVLSSIKNLEKYGTVIVAQMPSEFYQHIYLRNLTDFSGLVFWEGNLPLGLIEELNLQRLGNHPDENEAMALRIDQKELREFVEEKFSRTLENNCSAINLIPKRVSVKNKELARQELRTGKQHKPEIRIQDITLSYLLAFRNRYRRFGEFFVAPESIKDKVLSKIRPSSNPKTLKQNSLTLFVWVDAISKLDECAFSRQFESFVTEASGASKIATENMDAEAFEAALICGAAKLELSRKTGHLDEKSRSEIAKLKSLAKKELLDTNSLSTLAAITLFFYTNDLDISSALEKLEKVLLNDPKRIPGELFWVLYRVSKSFAAFNNEAVANHLNRIIDIVITNVGDAVVSNRKLNGFQYWEYASYKALRDQDSSVFEIFGELLDKAFDEEKGIFFNCRIQDQKFTVANNYQISPWITIVMLETLGRIEIWDPSKATNNYSDEHLIRWERSPLKYDYLASEEAESILTLIESESTYLGLFKIQNINFSSFPLLSYLVHFHTMHPLSEAFFDCPAKEAVVIEEVFVKWLHLARTKHGLCYPTVSTWPWSYDYCLTVRHDVDRPMSPDVFEELTRFERDKSLGVSWYWIPGRLDTEQASLLQSFGHEIGLHALRVYDKKNEISNVSSVLTEQERIYGEQYHGGGGGDYWIGYPSIVASIDANLSYTEHVSTIHNYPYYSFPRVDEAGIVSTVGIVGTSHTFSVDNPANFDPEFKKMRQEKLLEYSANGFNCVILNHPDINLEELKDWVNHMPVSNRLNWNCMQMANWWRATHSIDSLKLGATPEGLAVSSEYPIEDLQIDISNFRRGVSKVELMTCDAKPIELEFKYLSSCVLSIRVSIAAATQYEIRIH